MVLVVGLTYHLVNIWDLNNFQSMESWNKLTDLSSIGSERSKSVLILIGRDSGVLAADWLNGEIQIRTEQPGPVIMVAKLFLRKVWMCLIFIRKYSTALHLSFENKPFIPVTWDGHLDVNNKGHWANCTTIKYGQRVNYIACNVTLHREEKYNFQEHHIHYCLSSYWHLSRPQLQTASGQLNGQTRHLVRSRLDYEESLATDNTLDNIYVSWRHGQGRVGL